MIHRILYIGQPSRLCYHASAVLVSGNYSRRNKSCSVNWTIRIFCHSALTHHLERIRRGCGWGCLFIIPAIFWLYFWTIASSLILMLNVNDSLLNISIVCCNVIFRYQLNAGKSQGCMFCFAFKLHNPFFGWGSPKWSREPTWIYIRCRSKRQVELSGHNGWLSKKEGLFFNRWYQGCQSSHQVNQAVKFALGSHFISNSHCLLGIRHPLLSQLLCLAFPSQSGIGVFW